MGIRFTTTHGLRATGDVRWLLTAAIVALVLVMVFGAASASAASPTSCRVQNTDSGRAYARLQQAVDAAKPGARLVVKGVCHGGTFIDKDIAIRGLKTSKTGKPVLDGDESARVLTIKPKVKVSIRDLVIQGGRATRIPDGGGISNKGRLTLRDVVVRDNESSGREDDGAWIGRGGGIYNEGLLHLRGRSEVTGNHVASFRLETGSGIYNAGRLILDDGSRIRSNSGGYGVVNAGTLVMNDSSNVGRNDGSKGSFGVNNAGTLVMNDASSISNDGSLANSGTLVMNDASSIHHNTILGDALFCATGAGGGVRNTGSLRLNDSASIHDNGVSGGCGPRRPPPADRARGGGVYNEGSLTMTGASSIHSNAVAWTVDGAAGLGGGLYNASGGTLTGVNCAQETGANVYANTPDDCHFESP
jgi:hypothetical protein